MKWKRWTIAVLTLSLLLALAACGPAQDATDPTGEDSTTHQTGENDPPEDTQTTQENQDGQNGAEAPAKTDTVPVPESAPVDAGCLTTPPSSATPSPSPWPITTAATARWATPSSSAP